MVNQKRQTPLRCAAGPPFHSKAAKRVIFLMEKLKRRNSISACHRPLRSPHRQTDLTTYPYYNNNSRSYTRFYFCCVLGRYRRARLCLRGAVPGYGRDMIIEIKMRVKVL